MKIKLSKTEAQKQIESFFSDVKNKTSNEVKKIKRLAMRYNIKLGEKRKLFCKKCYDPYKTFSIKIKNDSITITCGKCENKSRWKIK